MIQAEKAPEKPVSRGRRLFQNVLRFALIALVIWTCYWAAKTVKRIAAGPRIVAPQPQEATRPEPTFQALSNQPEPGYWAFDRQPWAIAQTKISPADFERHLLARLTAKNGNTKSDIALLTEFKNLGSPTKLVANGTLYRANAAGGPFAVTRGADASERLVTAGLVMPEADGNWLLLEMLPTPDAPQQPGNAAETLLPLPPTAKRLMARWSNAGELLLEWVHVPVPASEIVEQWHASGLKLRPTRGMLGAESSYLYQQNGEVIIVNAFPSNEGGADLLIARSSDVVPSSEVSPSDRTH